MADKHVNTELKVSNGRLSYFHGFTKDDFGKFSLNLIIPQNHPQIAEIKAMNRQVAEAKWGDKALTMLKQLDGQNRLYLRRGDVVRPDDEAYAGNLVIVTSSVLPPKIYASVGGVNVEVEQDHERAPYSGSRANIIFNVWAQDNEKGGKRLNAGLLAIQFAGHDKRLSAAGRVVVASEFGITASEADGDAPVAEEEDAGGLV